MKLEGYKKKMKLPAARKQGRPAFDWTTLPVGAGFTTTTRGMACARQKGAKKQGVVLVVRHGEDGKFYVKRTK